MYYFKKKYQDNVFETLLKFCGYVIHNYFFRFEIFFICLGFFLGQNPGYWQITPYNRFKHFSLQNKDNQLGFTTTI